MPTAWHAATVAKPVPGAAESSSVTRMNRTRLARVLAARPAGEVAPAAQLKSNGDKQKKPKLVSNRCKMPDTEYAQLAALKKRLSAMGIGVKKSTLLRAGLMLLVDMGDGPLKKAMAKFALAHAARPAANAGWSPAGPNSVK